MDEDSNRMLTYPPLVPLREICPSYRNLPKSADSSRSSLFSSHFIFSRSGMPGEKTYTLAIGRWRRSGIVTIRSVLDTKIARFPIGFLASCGDNTWDYISFVVGLLVEADPQHPASIIDQITGQSVRPDDAPVPGTYRLVEQGALIWSGLSEAFILALIFHNQARTAKFVLRLDRRILLGFGQLLGCP